MPGGGGEKAAFFHTWPSAMHTRLPPQGDCLITLDSIAQEAHRPWIQVGAYTCHRLHRQPTLSLELPSHIMSLCRMKQANLHSWLRMTGLSQKSVPCDHTSWVVSRSERDKSGPYLGFCGYLG